MGETPLHPHVLLIDDSQDMLTLFQRLFESEGYHVTASRDLLDKAHLTALAPDVIVLELLTARGVEAGWEYLGVLSRDPHVAGVPVVLCTTAGWSVLHPPMAARLALLGVRVLIKPCRLTDLVGAVAEALAATARG